MSEALFTKDQLNQMSVEDLLNVDISSIKEIEGYKPVPTAQYRLMINACGLDVIGKDDKQIIAVEVTLLEGLEYEAADEALPDDTFPREYKETFFVDGKDKMGLAKFRTVFGPFAAANGLTTISAIMEKLNEGGITGTQIITHRSWKDKETGEMRSGNEFDLSGFTAD